MKPPVGRGEWPVAVPWGYKRAKDDTKEWLIKVPGSANPMEDQFTKRIQAKKECMAKKEMNFLWNLSREHKMQMPSSAGLHPKGHQRSVGKESSQAYTISEQEQRMKRLEKLKRDLERMSNERDELRGILAHYINKDLNNRFNFETNMLEMQHDQVMSKLKNIPQQISEALYKCQELTKNNQLYSIRNCHLLTESLHMKSEVKMLWNENRQLLKEQITLDVF
ncbi:disks large homolog 5-like [Arvicanthis niloticus]|uniref:disks large homolog 5-like n=1 Tax=Arvicanthis niloticus TaxID=61156 RepID=UPI00402B2AB1